MSHPHRDANSAIGNGSTRIEGTKMIDAAPRRLFLVDDNEDVLLAVNEALGTQYKVDYASTCLDAAEALKKQQYDLILVDIGLPDQNGLDFCKLLRTDTALDRTPVIMLSGLTNVERKVEGFENGADDYIVKPFDPKEFRARINAVMKRCRASDADTAFGCLRFDLTVQRVYADVSGSEVFVDFTPVEFRLLLFLAKRGGEPASRDDIMRAVWPENIHVVPDNIYTHIYAIRRKLADMPVTLLSVPGKGYVLNKTTP